MRDGLHQTDTLLQERPLDRRRRIVLALALGAERVQARTLLHVGRPLAYEEAHALARSGWSLTRVARIDDALTQLDERAFDAVLVDPSIETDADGVRLVALFKSRDATESFLPDLVQRYRDRPFVVLLLPDQYEAALLADGSCTVFDTRRVPLARVFARR